MTDRNQQKLSRHLVDPELLEFAESFPDTPITMGTLQSMRDRLQSTELFADAIPPQINRKWIELSSSDSLQSTQAVLYQNRDAKAGCPAFLHIHGGGMIAGSARAGDFRNLRLCEQLGITIISVEYRLAPEHPYPAALDDCFAGLKWLHENAESLNIDPAYIAVGGESAGGGLAASLCQIARDEDHYPIAYQHLVYPMLDSRTGTPGFETDPLVGEYIWTLDKNRFGWQAYLGSYDPAPPVVPALEKSLKGLPPTWLAVGQLDLFRDENEAYANRLKADGVATEFWIIPGAYHGFTAVKHAAISQQFEAEYINGFRRQFSGKLI